MDNIAHGLTGALIAKSVGAEKVGQLFFWTLVVAAELPDFDVFIGFLGTKAYLFYHRGITHSFFGILIQALLVTSFLFLFYPRNWQNFFYFFSISSAILLVHILSDWATSYGTPILSPFSSKNYSLDWISNLSLIVIALISFGLLLNKIFPTQKNVYINLTWLFLAVFVLFGFLAHQRAKDLIPLSSPFSKGGKEGDVIPHPINPLIWRGIVRNESEKTYQLYRLDLLNNKIIPTATIPLPEYTPVVNATLKEERVILFSKHNRWPVEVVKKVGNNWQVWWSNLLFGMDGKLHGWVIVELDKNLKVVSSIRTFRPMKVGNSE